MLRLICILCILFNSLIAFGDDKPTFEINIKNHKFEPEEVVIPADTKVRLIVKNLDDTIEEFESFDLKKEKIVPANSQIKVIIGPLKSGEYNFFGEFNPKTAQGKIIVK
jgi:hypothetical protein